MSNPLVGIIMGSQSDLSVMQDAAQLLTEFGIAHEVRIVSAHRTPEWMMDYAKTAADRGLRVIIAGAVAPPIFRHGSLITPAGNWSSGAIKQFHRRLGLDPFHPPNAQWSSGCNGSDQRGTKCRYTGRADIGSC